MVFTAIMMIWVVWFIAAISNNFGPVNERPIKLANTRKAIASGNFV